MKEHNTDYLSTESLRWHPRLGIHSANVAPEFGVAETKAFISVLKEKGHIDLLDDFFKEEFQGFDALIKKEVYSNWFNN